jgi:hypothetical protein
MPLVYARGSPPFRSTSSSQARSNRAAHRLNYAKKAIPADAAIAAVVNSYRRWHRQYACGPGFAPQGVQSPAK